MNARPAAGNRRGEEAMQTQLRTVQWQTWAFILVLLILVLSLVYLAY